MLGEPPRRHRNPAAWRDLRDELGVILPGDYQEILDAYAPAKINGHLYLSHPANGRWNLGEWIRDTSEAWSQIDWDDVEAEGDPRISLGVSEFAFGAPDGLIPIASTDRRETIFYAPRGGFEGGVLFVESEGEFFEYSMTFSEWLYRWLIGEDVAGPNSSAFYPGPVTLQDLPMTPDERPETRYGPPRGM
ncbi:SMI1/KNR4 family protein [Streptomyces sp. NPDC050263]|uniref:SMI1/KNR4 family protein n=1 Tax=Streptomyces sp. NPDC050263 TaxID=3155037 RepID=UPI00343605F8